MLARAVMSVFTQSFQDFEIIIVDDGSVDGTEEYVAKELTDNRVRFFRFNKNMGVHTARNKGLDEVQGDYIVFLDSDDELFVETLATVQNVFNNYPTVGFMGGPYVNDDGELTGPDREKPGIVPYEEVLCERKQRRIKGGFAALRASVVKGIRWEVQYLQFIFYRRVSQCSDTYMHHVPLGIYHMKSDKYSVTLNRAKPNIELSIKRAEVLDRYLDGFEADFLKFCPYNLSFPAYGAAMGLLLANKRARARRRAGQAFRYNRTLKNFLVLLLCFVPKSNLLLGYVYRFVQKD